MPRRHPAERVGLVVVIDGDHEGYLVRKRKFEQELESKAVRARAPRERVAICVPTWSIETWLAWLCAWRPADGDLDESSRLKDLHEFQKAVKTGQIEIKAAVDAWNQTPAIDTHRFPSLLDARTELDRLS